MKILKNSNAWKKNHDLTGKTYGLLKVLEFKGFKKLYDKGGKRRSHFLCKCKCGKEKIIPGIQLHNGQVKSCGTCLIHPKYKIDENYFKKINREDKAYFFGLLLTDGTIDGQKKSKRIVISLDKKDSHILETFNRYLKTQKPVSYTKRKARKYKYYNYPAREYCTLNISNVKMHKDIIKLGLKPNKTKTVKFPSNKIIPHRLMRHFIRGVFDGDGSVFLKKYSYGIGKSLAFVSGSFLFMKSFQRYLKKYKIANTSVALIKRKSKFTGNISSYSTLTINPGEKKYGNKGTKDKKIVALNYKNFFNLIYKNCSKDLYLIRKYNKFKEVINI